MEALQESSSKLNEDRIFELKQRLEDLLMENDTLSEEGQRLKREVKSLRYEVVAMFTMVDSVVCCMSVEKLVVRVSIPKNLSPKSDIMQASFLVWHGMSL